jgi:hypothetical protein
MRCVGTTAEALLDGFGAVANVAIQAARRTANGPVLFRRQLPAETTRTGIDFAAGVPLVRS